MPVPVPKTEFDLPQLLENWPWSRLISPYYLEVKNESSQWMNEFNLGPRMKKKHDRCNFALLSALTYGWAKDKNFIRASTDLIHFIFVYDEYTDKMNKADAQKIADICMDAMRNPSTPRPEGEHLLGEMARQVFLRLTDGKDLNRSCVTRYVTELQRSMCAISVEADDRNTNCRRKVDDYMALRRYTSGAFLVFNLVEFPIDLPEDVLMHPQVALLTKLGGDMMIIVNDLNSYVKEHAAGEDLHNLLSAIMYEYDVDLTEALLRLKAYSDAIVARFLDCVNVIDALSFGEVVDVKLKTYVNALGYWIRGWDDWSFEGGRYFEDGEAVRRSGKLTLRPPKPTVTSFT